MTTQTFDPHTATLDQCCDYIAECMLYRQCIPRGKDNNGESRGWHRPGLVGRCQCKDARYGRSIVDTKHPVPPTLDSIARSSPEDVSVIFVAGPKPEWVCTLGIGSGCVKTWVTAGADTELLARARCSALAWKTVKEAKQ